MNELIEKISSYNFFNYLFPGILFAYLSQGFTSFSFVQEDLVIGFFIYYFLGLIISRIGSLVIEPIFENIKFSNERKKFKTSKEWKNWKKKKKAEDYDYFISASKKDPKVELLSEVNNMYRTICSTILLIFILIFYEFIKNKIPVINEITPYVLLISLLLIFLLAYRKQSEYINKRIKSIRK